ncbi:alpha/beta hydrolase family protein [Salimicrobium halophilum]|uniref:Acetyl esterase/lipase n=1 Tax=Salimicrobium halophilum TaxID=86666 RepID=A0A1G8UC07_9BACI|nr:alpha/beta hydrolase [Salimicrobium halophilum]SDJ51297.1 Acetyl esterase/lipase [Salimicrobium halophilum]
MQKIYYGEKKDHFGELRLPDTEGPYPVAIVIHGGFWKSEYGLEETREIAEDLTADGWATWNIEYSRVGQDAGGWPGTFLDAAQATDALFVLQHDHPLDLKRVVTIGHSAGGHLALWLAGRKNLPETSYLYKRSPLPLAAAVSLAGVNELKTMHDVHRFRDDTLNKSPDNPTADLLGGSPEEVPERFRDGSPKELLPLSTMQILVHGALDINVPVGISDDYQEWAENMGDPVKYVRMSDAEHFMLTDTSTRAWKRVKEEMDLLLRYM